MNPDKMINEILKLGTDDWVGIWELPWLANSLAHARNSDEEREVSLLALKALLSQGLIEIGTVSDQGFVSWRDSNDAALNAIDRAWRDLPNSPRLGDIGFWINLTKEGEARAASL